MLPAQAGLGGRQKLMHCTCMHARHHSALVDSTRNKFVSEPCKVTRSSPTLPLPPASNLWDVPGVWEQARVLPVPCCKRGSCRSKRCPCCRHYKQPRQCRSEAVFCASLSSSGHVAHCGCAGEVRARQSSGARVNRYGAPYMLGETRKAAR